MLFAFCTVFPVLISGYRGNNRGNKRGNLCCYCELNIAVARVSRLNMNATLPPAVLSC
jgi:hypothetical protein